MAEFRHPNILEVLIFLAGLAVQTSRPRQGFGGTQKEVKGGVAAQWKQGAYIKDVRSVQGVSSRLLTEDFFTDFVAKVMEQILM